MGLKYYITHPTKLYEACIHTKIGFFLSDQSAISQLYRIRFGRKIDLEEPKSFNEKVLWLTLHDRKDKYNIMVDKLRAKDYISSIVGEGYTPRTLGVYHSSSEIEFDKLPPKYVLKCNHDSGSVVLCNNNTPIAKELNDLDRHLKKNYFWFSREWYYKNVHPVIFAEEYIDAQTEVQGGLIDYKVYCFNGTPYMTCVISDRATKAKLSFMDLNWDKLNVKQRYENHDSIPRKPKNYREMLRIAEQLSKDIPFLRVDFFEDFQSKLYVGELTFVPSSALIPFEPDSFDYELGQKLDLGGLL